MHKSIKDYLQLADAQTLHVAVLGNTDIDFFEFAQLFKDDANTEKGTILLLYWKMRPRMVKSKALEGHMQYEDGLLKEIEEKYTTGFYKGCSIGYNPYYEYIKDNEYSVTIPSPMLNSTSGKEIIAVLYDQDHKLVNGLTPELYDQIKNGFTEKSEEPQNITPIKEEENTQIISNGTEIENPQIDSYHTTAINHEPVKAYEPAIEIKDVIPPSINSYTETLKYRDSDISCDADIERAMELKALEFLKKSPADILYCAIREYPFDFCSKIVAYYKDRPDTEKATILSMYWRMNPHFSKLFLSADEAREEEKARYGEVYYDLIEDIEQKYTSGFYKNAGIATEADFFSDNFDKSELVRPIPDIMFVPIEGIEIDVDEIDLKYDLEDGYPSEIWNEYDRLDKVLNHKTQINAEQDNTKNKGKNNILLILSIIFILFQIIRTCR